MGDSFDSARHSEPLERDMNASDGDRASPSFQRNDWLAFGATTAVALVGYLVTLAPDVTLEVSGTFSVGAMYGGEPHPPGYPLWTMLAWVFIKLLPVGNIAWRLAVMSAVAGAFACGLIALMVSKGGAALAGKIPGLRPLAPKGQKWLCGASGYAAGLVFAFNGAFWQRAVIADVWALSILMLCLVLCLLMRWSLAPKRRRYLYGASILYGMAVTNSQLLLAAAPAIPVLVASWNRPLGRDMFLAGGALVLAGLAGMWFGWLPIFETTGAITTPSFRLLLLFVGGAISVIGIVLAVKTRGAFTEWRTLLICAVLGLLGLALYFYSPIASMTNPPMNWAYPRTVQGFYHLLSRGQYERIVVPDDAQQFLAQLWMYVQVTGQEFGWLFLPVLLVPFAFLHRMPAWNRRWILGLLAAYVCLAFLMLAVLNPSRDNQSRDLIKVFFSDSYVVLAIWLGYGLILLGVRLMKRPQPSPGSSPPVERRDNSLP
jgi:hypothetical protein